MTHFFLQKLISKLGPFFFEVPELRPYVFVRANSGANIWRSSRPRPKSPGLRMAEFPEPFINYFSNSFCQSNSGKQWAPVTLTFLTCRALPKDLIGPEFGSTFDIPDGCDVPRALPRRLIGLNSNDVIHSTYNYGGLSTTLTFKIMRGSFEKWSDVVEISRGAYLSH